MICLPVISSARVLAMIMKEGAGLLTCNGVLDLDAGVDLDEVVAVLLVDEELGGTSVAVVDGLGELHCVVQDGVANVLGKVLGGGDLDDLLMSPLDGAVALIEMDNVAVVVAEKLNLDMLGLVEEALDEDGAVAEGGLGFRSCALERFLERLLLADASHTSATATKSSLDDDRESVLVRKLLNLLELLDGALRTRHNGDIGSNSQLSSGNFVTKSVDHLR